MLARRIKRDVEHRGRTVDGILDQYVLNSQSALSRSSPLVDICALLNHHMTILSVRPQATLIS